jgi:hypothetical protein
MSMNRERTLSRDVTATQIPSGDKQTLTAGPRVFIHQTLGGSYTVQTDFGLFRIDGKDGDSIGEQSAERRSRPTLSRRRPDPEAVWDAAEEGVRPGDSGQHRRPRPRLLDGHRKIEEPEPATGWTWP